MRRTVMTVALAAAAGIASAQSYTATRIASGLARPVYVGSHPDDTDRLFIIEQRSGNQGRIRVFDRNTGTVLPTPFATITVSTSSEQGLLGMAFHPDFMTNGQIYVNYTDGAGRTRIAEYTASSANPNVADTSLTRNLMVISQPFSNHNAGWLDFGPDGYLYIATGDGGSGNDPGNRSQDITNQLLGKMLRIDVEGDDFPGDAQRNYSIPASNPFVGITGDDEIWAYGLRNAWRNDFDPATGDLFIADVGQNAREEVSLQPASSTGGENYGWRCLEGTRTTGLSGCNPNDPSLIPPIIEYTHSFGCSITGGIIYRGCNIPSLQGAYLYADVCTNRIWRADFDGSSWNDTQIQGQFSTTAGALTSIVHFGRDSEGEMYIATLGGNIFRIDANEANGDWNNNGTTDIFDILAFLTDWENNVQAADLNANQSFDVFDILAFLELWDTPCGSF